MKKFATIILAMLCLNGLAADSVIGKAGVSPGDQLGAGGIMVSSSSALAANTLLNNGVALLNNGTALLNQ